MKKNLKLTPKLKAMLDAAPEFTFEEMGIKPGKVLARGPAEIEKYLKSFMEGKTKDPKVCVDGIKHGDLGTIPCEKDAVVGN